jgi:hypothetical protein
MIRPNSGIYVTAMMPVFNEKIVTPLGKLDANHTSQLYSNLFLNHKENLDRILNHTSITYCFNNNDRNHLPEQFTKEHLINIFSDTDNSYQNIKNIADKFFSLSNINLIVFANSIGYSTSDLNKILDLLTIESDAVVIGKSINGGVSFIGFNYINQDLIKDIHWSNIQFDNLLHKVNRFDNFVYVWENSLIVNSGKDFKLLYSELSRKESLEYCSQQMHEKFTHIFIEYKDLLK